MTTQLKPSALRRRHTFAIGRLAAVARRGCAERLAEVGLGQYQHAVLCCLDEFGPQVQKDVAVRLGIDSGDIVAFVDDLHRAELVRRERDTRDRRRQILTLTDAGRAALARAELLLDQAAADLLAPLPAADRDRLYELMLRVLAHTEPESWVVSNGEPVAMDPPRT